MVQLRRKHKTCRQLTSAPFGESILHVHAHLGGPVLRISGWWLLFIERAECEVSGLDYYLALEIRGKTLWTMNKTWPDAMPDVGYIAHIAHVNTKAQYSTLIQHGNVLIPSCARLL